MPFSFGIDHESLYLCRVGKGFAFPRVHTLLPDYVFVALKLEIDLSPAKASLQLPRAGHVGQANFGEEVVRILCVL